MNNVFSQAIILENVIFGFNIPNQSDRQGSQRSLEQYDYDELNAILMEMVGAGDFELVEHESELFTAYVYLKPVNEYFADKLCSHVLLFQDGRPSNHFTTYVKPISF